MPRFALHSAVCCTLLLIAALQADGASSFGVAVTRSDLDAVVAEACGQECFLTPGAQACKSPPLEICEQTSTELGVLCAEENAHCDICTGPKPMACVGMTWGPKWCSDPMSTCCTANKYCVTELIAPAQNGEGPVFQCNCRETETSYSLGNVQTCQSETDPVRCPPSE